MLEKYAQKQCGQIEGGLSPSHHTGWHGGMLDQGVDVDQKREGGPIEGSPKREGGPKRLEGPKRQDKNEKFGPSSFLPFVGYNRDIPGKVGFLFTVIGFISGIH